MRNAAENLEFEEAARIRDEIKNLENIDLQIIANPLNFIPSSDDKNKGRSKAGMAGTKYFKGKMNKSY